MSVFLPERAAGEIDFPDGRMYNSAETSRNRKKASEAAVWIGVLLHEGDDLRAAIARADEKMYRDKESFYADHPKLKRDR